MFEQEICSIIDIDEKGNQIHVYNYTDNPIYKAFGNKKEPSFLDYMSFIQSRCFPEERDKLKLVLQQLDIPFYDPLMIIEKTQGRMEYDLFWIKIERSESNDQSI